MLFFLSCWAGAEGEDDDASRKPKLMIKITEGPVKRPAANLKAFKLSMTPGR